MVKAKKTAKRKAVKRKTVKRKTIATKPTRVAKPKKRGRSPAKRLAIAGLVINALVIFWLGSLIMGRNEWKPQLILWLLGIVFTVTLIGAIIGIPLLILGYFWGIISGVRAISEAR